MSPSTQTMGFFMSEINFCNTKEQLNHLGEVVTGKTNGSPSGADIDTSTLPYTGQVRKTLPALEQEYIEAIRNAGGQPLNGGVWATGQTFTAYNQYMIYNNVPYKPLATTTLPYGPTGSTPDTAFVGPYESLSVTNIASYAPVSYQGDNPFDKMVSGDPIELEVGEVSAIKGSIFERIVKSAVSSALDFEPKTDLNIEAFGAKADYFLSNGSVNPTPTDNSTIINGLIDTFSLLPIRSEFASTYRIYIPPKNNKFYCADSVVFSRNATLFGGGGLQFGASCLIFAPNVTGLIIPHPGGATAPVGYPYTNGGTYSIIEGIKIECSDTASSTSGYGVLSNTTFTMRDVWIDGFAQENMFINANAVGNGIVPDGRDVQEAGTYFGNANLFVLENIKSWNSKSDALRILGKDANAGIIRMFDGSRSDGCGILDQSTLGNTYIGCHNAINGTKVENNGEFYQCRKYHTSQSSNEPGVGVDWKEYWQKVVATTPDAQWASGVEYFRTGSFHSVNDAANNTLIGHYSEGGIQGVVELSKNDVVMGGTLSGGTNRDSVNVTIAGASGNSPWEFKGDDGTYKFSNSVGGLTSDLAVFQRFHHEHDVSPLAYQLEYSVPRSSYEYSSRHSGIKRVMAFTGQNWSDEGYTGTNMFFESGVIIGGSKNAKLRSSFSLATITGEVVKGELFILTGSNAGGKAFAKVTTSGIAGSTAVIKECGAIDA